MYLTLLKQHKICSFFQSDKSPSIPGGAYFICKAPKRAMHKADGGLMESTTDTNRKQADKRNSQLKDGNEYDGGENAC